jgi:pyrroloquinoline quinone (PQQ) biosynthesis protein C
MGRREQLLGLYDLFPFHRHPLWRAVTQKELPIKAVLRAEIQHYLRTKAGQQLRKEAVEEAAGVSAGAFDALVETYLEECTTSESGPDHLSLIERLLLQGGVTKGQLNAARNTPGNTAAIAIYRDIAQRGVRFHTLGAGAVEYFYSELCPKVYSAYVEHYGMTPAQAETYSLHSSMDKMHAERAFGVLDEAIAMHGWRPVEGAVRDAFTATSLHYDGMLQAATGKNSYWDGTT